MRIVMNLDRLSPYGYNRQRSTVVPITRIVIHPSYNHRTLINDIALLFFSPTRATDNQSIASFCPLSPGIDFFAQGSPVIITGYGTIQSGGPTSPTLRVANIFIMKILDTYYSSSYTQHPGQFIAGDYQDLNNPDDNQDTCQGDSGGPVYARDTKGSLHAIGLTSWGTGCALDHYPGFYTNLCFYQNWIQTVQQKFRWTR